MHSRIADSCEVPLIAIDLSSLFSQLIHDMYQEIEAAGLDIDVVQKAVEEGPFNVLGSIRSCLRAPIGRGFNRMRGGGIRHGTGNECEDRWLRFYQKGGDGEVDSNPIDMLAKGEVYQLAHHLKLPRINSSPHFPPPIFMNPERLITMKMNLRRSQVYNGVTAGSMRRETIALSAPSNA